MGDIEWLSDQLIVRAENRGIDLMDVIKDESYDEYVAVIGYQLDAHEVKPVYDYLMARIIRERDTHVDLVEVTRGQWSSLISGVSYVARMGVRIEALSSIGHWWLFGDVEIESLDDVQQIWQVIER